MDIENGYYQVRFLNRTDYDRIFSQVPWIICGQYLTFQPWTNDFSLLQPYPSVALAWIQLQGLLGFMFYQKIVEAIGGLIGKVEYEALPTACFGGSKYMHAKDLCPVVAIDRTSECLPKAASAFSAIAGKGAVEETG
ncbi:hypothetical protein PVK06_017359 [Gossypium arboreum]|uniref:DUF4283 domain-containing protein n=1 Tax=Gossypium arboreum TaxID=29729 RepID=A0ABR0Q2G2_GOSAR|nr:hypothetical protein PVK06_017359 [Gossypium arboreum]